MLLEMCVECMLLQVFTGLYTKCASLAGCSIQEMTRYISWKHSALEHLQARSVDIIELF